MKILILNSEQQVSAVYIKALTMIVMVMGLPGSGKTYFASRLAKAIDAEYLSSDRLRKTIITKRTYSEKEKGSVYDEMLLRMRKVVKKKKDIVLDATFYKSSIRKKFIMEGEGLDDLILIEIIASEPVIEQRLKKIREDSEADFRVYKIIKAEWEPVVHHHLILQSENDNIEDMLHTAISYLHSNEKRRD